VCGKRKRRRKTKKKDKGESGWSCNLAHFNPRGLRSKAPFLKAKLTGLGVVFCGIAESQTYRAKDISDENYVWDPGVENRPSPSQPHPPGGIGGLVSRDVSHSTVASSKYSVWARLEMEGGVPIFICECYFPHSAQTRQHRAAWREISERAKEYGEVGHVVVMGDFNAHTGINGGITDAAGRMLTRNAAQLDLTILNGTDICDGGHTRVMEGAGGCTTATTIDFMMVSRALLPHVTDMTVINDRMSSDHHMLVLRLRGLRTSPGAGVKLRSVWRVEDIPHYKDPDYKAVVCAYQEAFRAWHRSTKATMASLEAGVAEEGDSFEKSFQMCLDAVSLEQIGRKLIGPSSSGLMTQQIKALNAARAGREKELQRVQADRSSSEFERTEAVQSYRRAKAAVQKAVGARQEELELQIFRQIESTQSDSKLFWSHVTKISGGLLGSVSPPPMASNAEGEVMTDPLEVLKVWKEFSSRIANPGPEDEFIYDEEHKTATEQRLWELRADPIFQATLDGPITRQEVFDAIRKLKAGKAPGVDGITTTILKMAADAVGSSKLKGENHVVDSLVLLFNFVFDNETWPDRWATGIIFPLYKQDSRLDPGNYRPITLLSVIGKLFGSVIECRLSTWAEGGYVLADEQGGFRRCRGTPDLIFLLREIILTRKLRGQCTLTTFIDARKAYDTVWREGNYVRLHDMGVRGKLWRQLQAMSSDPKSKVRLPFGETDYFRVSRGVAQGAVESPFLYACFINGLAEELKSKGLGIVIAGKPTPLLMYADDVVLLAGSVEELRAMNDVVSEYARRNRYRLNGDKSAVMAFNADSTTALQVQAEPWRLSGEIVKIKDSYKYLGVDVLENVTNWEPYLNRAIAKARRVTEDLEWACRRAGGLRPRSAAALWKAMVRPILEYSAEIWAGDITKSAAARAESVQTNFARSMMGLLGCQSISNDSLRAEMGMEKLSSRWAKLRLGYWRRLHVASSERTLTAVAALRHRHVMWEYKGADVGWMGTARDLLIKHGMYSHWLNPNLCATQSKEQWKDVVYEAVEGIEDEALRTRFAGMAGAAAATYCRIKNWDKTPADLAVMRGEEDLRGAQVIEPYLDGRAEPVGTRLKLMCRLGCLPTMARVAREENMYPEHGYCRMCDSGAIEDIQHLLLACPSYERHRVKMINVVDRALIQAGKEPLGNQCQGDQADTLLGRSTGVAVADGSIGNSVTRFLKKSWRQRKWLTSSLNAMFGRQDTVWALRAHGDKCRLATPAPNSGWRGR
jgi:hypothetical protein